MSKRIENRERMKQALELRKAGFTYQQIADNLGYSSFQTASRSVRRALNLTIQEPADGLRKLELERLNKLLSGIWSRAIAGDDKAVKTAISIIEQIAKLMGLYSPLQIEQINIDYTSLTNSQLERIARGERIDVVLSDDQGESGAGKTQTISIFSD